MKARAFALLILPLGFFGTFWTNLVMLIQQMLRGAFSPSWALRSKSFAGKRGRKGDLVSTRSGFWKSSELSVIHLTLPVLVQSEWNLRAIFSSQKKPEAYERHFVSWEKNIFSAVTNISTPVYGLLWCRSCNSNAPVGALIIRTFAVKYPIFSHFCLSCSLEKRGKDKTAEWR